MKSGSLTSTAQAVLFLSQISERRCSISDAKVKGLQLERLRTGVGKWRLRCEDEDGRGRSCITLGDAPLLSLAEARSLAEKAKKQIAMGEHPAAKKALQRQVPTVADFISKQYVPYVEGYKKSWQCDEGLLRNHVTPFWGKLLMSDVTKADVITLFAQHRKTHKPGSCNRLLILVRFMFNLALRWETPGVKSNPTAGFPLMKEDNKHERYLSREETEALYEQLKVSQNPMLRYIVPMLILTGARKREAMNAKWSDFDFEHRRWRIPVTKLGKPRHVPLSDGAITLLNSVPRHGCDWVFPNPKTLLPYDNIFTAWDTARTKAGLSEVRIHDLRHSFASFLVNSGRSLYEVQHLLGHTQIKTTQRYSHLSQDTLLDAANAASVAVGNFFTTPVATTALGAAMRPMAQPVLSLAV
jgi:integrase